MGSSFTELITILVIIILLFGPGKLPEVSRSLSKGIREFKNTRNKAKKQSSTTGDKPSK